MKNNCHLTENQRLRRNALARVTTARNLELNPKYGILRAVSNLYKSGPCMDCGETFPPVAMDFDHRDPTSKSFNVSRLSNHGGRLHDLFTEVAKCDLVCSNCHRVRTAGLMGWRDEEGKKAVSV